MSAHLDALYRKLESIGHLSQEDRKTLAAIEVRLAMLAPDEPAARDGDKPRACCLIVSGLMYRSKIVGHGGRQILAFHMPGDIPDLQSLFLSTLDHGLAAVVESVVAFIDHNEIRTALTRSPSLVSILWRDTLIDAGIFRAWIMGMGRLNSHDNLAHLFCELYSRMHAIGLCSSGSCHLPLTQIQLGDALGLSTVHVNRVIQNLRREKLIELENGRLTVLDWKKLQKAGDFDPTYLHIHESRRPIV